MTDVLSVYCNASLTQNQEVWIVCPCLAASHAEAPIHLAQSRYGVITFKGFIMSLAYRYQTRLAKCCSSLPFILFSTRPSLVPNLLRRTVQVKLDKEYIVVNIILQSPPLFS